MNVEDIKHWIYLINMQTIFFQRTNFIDVSAVKEWMETNIKIENNSKILFSINDYIPPLHPGAASGIKIILGELHFTISIRANQICINLNGAYMPNDYDTALHHFISCCCQIAPIVASDMYQCEAIDISSNSFLVTDKPMDIIRNKYMRPNELEDCSRLAVIFDREMPVAELPSQLMTTLKTDFINFDPVGPGVNIMRSLTMTKSNMTIVYDGLLTYFSAASKYFSFYAFEKLIY